MKVLIDPVPTRDVSSWDNRDFFYYFRHLYRKKYKKRYCTVTDNPATSIGAIKRFRLKFKINNAQYQKFVKYCFGRHDFDGSMTFIVNMSIYQQFMHEESNETS